MFPPKVNESKVFSPRSNKGREKKASVKKTVIILSCECHGHNIILDWADRDIPREHFTTLSATQESETLCIFLSPQL